MRLSSRHQRLAATATQRLAGLRRAVDAVLDRIRFAIDSFPWTYHPRGDGRAVARRSEGTVSRWREMERVVRELSVATAVDVGCNGGWFVLRLAESGIVVVGAEEDPRFCRMLMYEARKRGLERVGVLAIRVDVQTVAALPTTDAVLFLSVWHHVVRGSGLEVASQLLQGLWSRTEKVLFFDTGQDEVGPEFGLPAFAPDPATWLTEYLGRVCEGSDVRQLGEHAAFSPAGQPCVRTLFAVLRRPR